MIPKAVPQAGCSVASVGAKASKREVNQSARGDRKRQEELRGKVLTRTNTRRGTREEGNICKVVG